MELPSTVFRSARCVAGCMALATAATFAPSAMAANDAAKRPNIIFIIIFSALGLLAAATAGAKEAARERISLNGTWEIAEGRLDQRPAEFKRTVPVPGLVDMAEPAFEAVGAETRARAAEDMYDTRREAYWYRRTFTVEGPVPEVALLKLYKAKYGVKVFLNGEVVAESPRSFTPVYCDVSEGLKGGGAENELVIRVASDSTSLPRGVEWGRDFEKKTYIAGIYDNVELILSGTPHIVNVQTAPDIGSETLRVVAEIGNAGLKTQSSPVEFVLRETESGRVAGRIKADSGVVAPGEVVKVDVTVPVAGCRLWSPEDPFLYTLEVRTAGDALDTRIGMRRFEFDHETKKPMLNGKVYYLRGSNITMYRFFEDPERGDKPWDKEWARRVIRKFKSMGWNSARYCIGFPPEIWYEVADEEGLLVQDEYPTWTLNTDKPALDLDRLVEEHTLWLRERWNHPSVYMWSAQNETGSKNAEVTAASINRVRGLDLQDRSWDNGWGKPQRPTDTKELHPYYFRAVTKRTLMEFSTWRRPMRHRHPIIINEYGWLWITRDGQLCTLPKADNSYEHLIPGEPPYEPEVLRRVYARTLAAITERYRHDRHDQDGRWGVVAVKHFCGLGYSRPDGETSDNFIDLEEPAFEPHFEKYVGHAFKPVGVMLDYWTAPVPSGGEITLKVSVINDLHDTFEGTVQLQLLEGDKVLRQAEKAVSVDPAGQILTEFPLTLPRLEPVTLPQLEPPYQLRAVLLKDGKVQAVSIRDLAVE